MSPNPMRITVGLPDSPDTPLLMISHKEREAIAGALARAAAEPITPGEEGDDHSDAAQEIAIPRGYVARITFEAQACGLCKHIAVRRADMRGLPSLDAVDMIAQEFGIVAGRGIISFWVDPTTRSANILALADPKGH